MSAKLNVGDLVTFNSYFDDRISFTCRKKVIGVGIITQRHYNSLFEHFDYSVVFGTYEMCSVPRVWLVKNGPARKPSYLLSFGGKMEIKVKKDLTIKP